MEPGIGARRLLFLTFIMVVAVFTAVESFTTKPVIHKDTVLSATAEAFTSYTANTEAVEEARLVEVGTQVPSPFPAEVNSRSVGGDGRGDNATGVPVSVPVGNSSVLATVLHPVSSYQRPRAGGDPIFLQTTASTVSTTVVTMTTATAATADDAEVVTAIPDVINNVTEASDSGTIFTRGYIQQKAEQAAVFLKSGEIKSASYFFAKIDDAPDSHTLLENIIRENYTTEMFNDTLEFVENIYNSSLRCKGYEVVLEMISKEERRSESQKDVLKLAHYLATRGKQLLLPQDLDSLMGKFANGVKAVAFNSYFTIKNIHDSYHLKYKVVRDGEYNVVTANCNKCVEGRLVASPDLTGLFKLSSKTLMDEGKDNCLGVQKNRVVFKTDRKKANVTCPLELWQLKFVGKTLATITYSPMHSEDEELERKLNYTLSGYGITRKGLNQKVELEAPEYLSTFQMWLVS